MKRRRWSDRLAEAEELGARLAAVAWNDLDADRLSPGWSPPVAREMADQIREKGQPIGDALTELIETPVPERGPWRW